jgi:long-chain acyl-CoA synthetase
MFEILSGPRRVDRETLQDHVLRVAAGLAALGIGEDDSVLLLMRNDIEFVEAAQAVTYLGAYTVSLNWHGTADEVRYIAQDANARAVVAHADLLHLAQGLAIPVIVVEPSQPIVEAYGTGEPAAWPASAISWAQLLEGLPRDEPAKTARDPIVYTSGTTGKPKGVRRFPPKSPQQAAAMRQHLIAAFGLGDARRLLAASPFYHSGPFSYLRSAIAAMGDDGRVVIVPKFDAEQVLALIQEHRIDHVWMVPTMFLALLRLSPQTRARYDVRSVRSILTSAAPCPPEVKKQMIEWFGPVIYEFYGSTEIGPVTLVTPQQAMEKPGTVGRVLPGAVLQVLSEEGQSLPAGGIGEIACRHESFPDFTYWNREAERRALARGPLVATGDIGYLDADGFVFLCDRKSHMIISGGVNIYPAEIEAIVQEHPAVKDCAVFGIPDERFGEAVALAIERLPGAALSEQEIVEFLKPRVASYKAPRLVQFHASLPRDDSGKIFKRVLRSPFWEKLGRSI